MEYTSGPDGIKERFDNNFTQSIAAVDVMTPSKVVYSVEKYTLPNAWKAVHIVEKYTVLKASTASYR